MQPRMVLADLGEFKRPTKTTHDTRRRNVFRWALEEDAATLGEISHAELLTLARKQFRRAVEPGDEGDAIDDGLSVSKAAYF